MQPQRGRTARESGDAGFSNPCRRYVKGTAISLFPRHSPSKIARLLRPTASVPVRRAYTHHAHTHITRTRISGTSRARTSHAKAHKHVFAQALTTHAHMRTHAHSHLHMHTRASGKGTHKQLHMQSKRDSP
eukprot:1812210-Pleurochrysis_carterae.AAC.1